MSSRRKKKKKSFKRNLIATIIVTLVLIIGYFYIIDIEEQEIAQVKSFEFSEPYQTLENTDPDSLLAIIMTEKPTNIMQISKEFYKSEDFWPYLLEANWEIENILDMRKGTIIRIPKKPSYLLNANNPQNIKRAKILGDSLLEKLNKEREEQRQPKEFF